MGREQQQVQHQIGIFERLLIEQIENNKPYIDEDLIYQHESYIRNKLAIAKVKLNGEKLLIKD